MCTDNIVVGLYELEVEEVAGHWDVEKVRSCNRRGRIGCPRGPDEERAVGLHEKLLLPSSDV